MLVRTRSGSFRSAFIGALWLIVPLILVDLLWWWSGTIAWRFAIPFAIVMWVLAAGGALLAPEEVNEIIFRFSIGRLLASIVVGIITGALDLLAYLVLVYCLDLSNRLHPPQPIPLSFVAMNASGAFSEEIFFRLFLLSFLMWIPFLRNESGGLWSVRFWIANACQAGLFGGIHFLQGGSILLRGNWALRLAATPQTWDGMFLGVVYWRWGIAAAVACHFLSNIFLWFLY
jgi:hypothetical protein